MIRSLALGALLLALAACNRHSAADVTLDADAAQRNATTIKTEADLAAADAASRGPAPVVRDIAPTESPAARSSPAPDADETSAADDAPDVPANDATPADPGAR